MAPITRELQIISTVELMSITRESVHDPILFSEDQLNWFTLNHFLNPYLAFIREKQIKGWSR
jgi:hypothetical protein